MVPSDEERLENLLDKLPKDKLVGTNNIKAYFDGNLSLYELKERCFKSLVINPDSTWTVIK